MKPTKEKSLAQIIFHIGTNDLVTNKDFNEVVNEIVNLPNLLKLIKTRKQYQALDQKKIS